MKRITSIDATRGIVMLLMLVDHAREFFYMHAQVSDPVDVTTTPLSLFFTRFAAHLCAPVFVGLTGLAAYLYADSRGGKKAASEFLFKRGLVLILLELTVISFGWTFTFPPATLFLQVIWAIGISMICLSGLLWLPQKILISIGALIVLGHNLLDPITFAPHESGHLLWAMIHDRGYVDIMDGMRIRTSYPVLPWIGVISLGYALGPWFNKAIDSLIRLKNLSIMGLGFIGAFILLRTLNIYGDLHPWKMYPEFSQSLMSFLNVTKYPPSADFILLTTGIGLLILAVTEKFSGKVTNLLSIFGASPMFFYIVHIYALHIVNHLLKAWLGPNQGIHFSVEGVSWLWLIMLISAFPLWFMCRWYGRIKRESGSKILSYL